MQIEKGDVFWEIGTNKTAKVVAVSIAMNGKEDSGMLLESLPDNGLIAVSKESFNRNFIPTNLYVGDKILAVSMGRVLAEFEITNCALVEDNIIFTCQGWKEKDKEGHKDMTTIKISKIDYTAIVGNDGVIHGKVEGEIANIQAVEFYYFSDNLKTRLEFLKMERALVSKANEIGEIFKDNTQKILCTGKGTYGLQYKQPLEGLLSRLGNIVKDLEGVFKQY